MIFCTELSSVRKTGSGTRSQPGLRKVRGDGGDIGVSVFGLNRLRSSRDGRKFVSWPRSGVYVAREEDVRGCGPDRWRRRQWRRSRTALRSRRRRRMPPDRP
jgi:hypothetical protein